MDMKLGRALWGEFVGTFFLTATVKIASSTNLTSGFAPFAIGFVLMNMIWCYGHISGGMFNPWVTTAIRIRAPDGWPGLNNVTLALYYAVQILGGIMGGFMANGVGGVAAAKVYPQVAYDDANKHYVYDDGQWKAFAAELMYTYLLCTVVLRVATDKRVDGNQFYGLAIGVSVLIGAISVGSISGGCFNLAVYIGCTISAAAQDSANMDHHRGEWWLYVLAGLIASVLAGLNFRFFFKDAESEGAVAIPDEDDAGYSRQLSSTKDEQE